VVICTLDRADALRATLASLRLQRHSDIEVVVVDGPSTDHTADVLREYGDEIKVARNPVRNLSISRNIGIKAAAGEFVAFVDDDALPEASWLAQILPSFADERVGGVGGIVFDHTGVTLQYRYSAANRFGEPEFSETRPFDELSVAGGSRFPYLQGTNAVFRRDALATIGLFDETFDYFLDETDLCCRLVDAGYRLRQRADAPVHHKYLPSATRNAARVVTNWYPIVKNQAYFAYRHAASHGELEIIDRLLARIRVLVQDTRNHVAAGHLDADQVGTAIDACGAGLAEGIRLGREARPGPLAAVELPPTKFRTFPTTGSSDGRRIAIVASDDPPEAMVTATRMSEHGHDVRVLAPAHPHSVDLVDGVWLHRLGGSSATAELARIHTWWTPDEVRTHPA
ncbi:MAG TPA: glycosyltransferase family 2 protein, partial [Ilumatobacteraceae bacterium]